LTFFHYQSGCFIYYREKKYPDLLLLLHNRNLITVMVTSRRFCLERRPYHTRPNQAKKKLLLSCYRIKKNFFVSTTKVVSTEKKKRFLPISLDIFFFVLVGNDHEYPTRQWYEGFLYLSCKSAYFWHIFKNIYIHTYIFDYIIIIYP